MKYPQWLAMLAMTTAHTAGLPSMRETGSGLGADAVLLNDSDVLHT